MPSATSPNVVLITGSNRGIGKTLLTTYLNRPSTTAIALVRDPSHPSSQSLPSIPKAKGSSLIVVPYDASSPDSAKQAVATLQSSHKITHLDVVIANSGILAFHGPSTSVTQADLISHFTINTVAPILLFSAVLPLLEKSSNPKFFTISSGLGSNGQLEAFAGMPLMPYNVSKAGVNYAMRKLHFEFPNIVVSPLTPGWVSLSIHPHSLPKK